MNGRNDNPEEDFMKHLESLDKKLNGGTGDQDAPKPGEEAPEGEEIPVVEDTSIFETFLGDNSSPGDSSPFDKMEAILGMKEPEDGHILDIEGPVITAGTVERVPNSNDDMVLFERDIIPEYVRQVCTSVLEKRGVLLSDLALENADRSRKLNLCRDSKRMEKALNHGKEDLLDYFRFVKRTDADGNFYYSWGIRDMPREIFFKIFYENAKDATKKLLKTDLAKKLVPETVPELGKGIDAIFAQADRGALKNIREQFIAEAEKALSSFTEAYGEPVALEFRTLKDLFDVYAAQKDEQSCAVLKDYLEKTGLIDARIDYKIANSDKNRVFVSNRRNSVIANQKDIFAEIESPDNISRYVAETGTSEIGELTLAIDDFVGTFTDPIGLIGKGEFVVEKKIEDRTLYNFVWAGLEKLYADRFVEEQVPVKAEETKE
ncbi:hypothetical protein KY325_04030 [Candidatus Woesearchaeota archaeon]|nr:hypothetical protein [Candidatus Woesearchaeota archaeon]